MKWMPILGAVVLDSSNNRLRFTEGATTGNADITAGTYFLRGDGTSDDLCKALKTALEAATASVNTYTVSVEITSSPIDGLGVTVNILRATGADAFSLLWADAASTLDEGIFGFPNTNTAHDAAAKVSSLNVECGWCGTYPPTTNMPGTTEGDTDQVVMVAGQVYSFDNGGPYKRRTLTFASLPGLRTNIEDEDAYLGSFERFWQTHRDGRALEVHSVTPYLDTTIATIGHQTLSSSTLVGGSTQKWVFDEDTCRAFRKTRSPVQALWRFDVGLRGYVA